MLQPGMKGEAQLLYINPKADFTAYDKIIIEPISVWRNQGSDMVDAPKEDLEYLVNYLYASLANQLDQDYEIVTRPGPGTMKLRIAITEVKGSKVAMDIFSTIVPTTRVLSEARNLATGTQAFVGKAAIEGELVDANSGERLLAAVDERAGGKSVRGATDEYSDVEEAYAYWAARLKIRLENLRTLSHQTR
jgi:hypothetical protein